MKTKRKWILTPTLYCAKLFLANRPQWEREVRELIAEHTDFLRQRYRTNDIEEIVRKARQEQTERIECLILKNKL